MLCVLMLLWCIDHVPGCTCYRVPGCTCDRVLMLLWCIVFRDVRMIVFLCYCGASIMFRDVCVITMRLKIY